ncbi:MAG: hypothetical protein H7A46_10930 [Verrucomicrobiales bacterium]|nr:hypothetical protein [Verrucomicrobiales bacterium]
METPLRLMRTPVAKGASWAAGSIPQARRLARQSDVIISTFGPWYMHVLGWFAKRANPGAFWCADYRDLWHARDFFMQGRPWRQAFMRRLEQFIVRPANLAVSVSPPLVASLAQTHPHIPGVTIYNGFPLSEHMPRRPPEVMRQRAVAGVPFDIVYTGTIYEGGYNDPEPLLRVLARNRWNRPVRLHFYGQSAASPLLRSLRDRYGLQESVVLPDQPLSRGTRSGGSGRRICCCTSGGPTGDRRDSQRQDLRVLASGSPVLSVGAEPDTAVGRLLQETGAGICVGRNESVIESHLERYVNEGIAPGGLRRGLTAFWPIPGSGRRRGC